MKVTKTILSTALVLSSAVTAFSDQVIADDLIVQFSLAVGNDAVNGENFGFDTMRLKENNLRIHFDDTSNSASFPNNDWRIVANDSSNGGANYLAIEDSTAGRIPFRVEAGARSNALYVEADGDVGFGTSNPAVNIHAVDGNTPTLRLEQDGTSGFTPQTWDVAGNEANFFVRDVNHSSSLPFRIKPGSGNDDAIVIAADGKIGMGTEAPDGNLHIEDNDGQVQLIMESTGANSAQWQLVMDHDGAANPGFSLTRAGTGVRELRIDHNGNLLVSGTISSAGTVLAVPDYVFGSDYELLQLGELKSFIENNRHLPNIPSQGDVLANGTINMTEMQMLLLEKVEELTLYAIDQYEINEEQSEIINRHEERIWLLEQKLAELLEKSQ